ncbi:MAG: hypothetical protein M1818_008442 [Claussenomyces sp. TS43310]|nr:MAG: hypothetical protein M1818_008442 [Claussenomyces sp. TS43310]
MSLTVLTDVDVKTLLGHLTLSDVDILQDSLRKALHEFSTGTQEKDACADHQPERTVLQSPNGTTTLFMPSTSASGIGMKVVTLVSPASSASSPSSVPPAAAGDGSVRGALTIMSKIGKPIGFVNAEEITAFRTALASSLLLRRRCRLKTLTVFGTGKQAFWHIRLALLLRGSTIKTVNIISRSFSDRTRNMVKTFHATDPAIKMQEGWSGTAFGILTPAYGEYGRLIKEQLRAADAIICTVPSTIPLFDHTILTSHEGRRKGRLIIAIGSYKPHMIEVPTELLQQAVKSPNEHRHFHKHAMEGGVVVVDTLTGCLAEAGEIIQSSLSPLQLVEVGELVMLEGQVASEAEPESDLPDLDVAKIKLEAGSSGSSLASVFKDDSNGKSVSRKSSFSRISPRSSRTSHAESHTRSVSMDGRKGVRKEDAMSRWLGEGNVIYKSVGMGLMDLVVGGDLLNLAVSKGIGTTIPQF